MPISIDQQKAAFRKRAKRVRLQAFQDNPQAGEKVAEHLLALPQLATPAKVSAFWPLPEELNTHPALHALHKQGHQMLLPIMQGAGKPLLFGNWQPGDKMIDSVFNTLEPSKNQHQHLPQVMLTPLLAFDRRGYRMGYGGGFYDRSIAQIKEQQALFTIGLAFSAQEVDAIITGPFDLALDIVVTEVGVLECF